MQSRLDLFMTNILVECYEKIASVQVGVLRPLEELVQKKKVQVRFCRTQDLKRQDFLWSDIYICVRGFGAVNYEVAKIAKKAGCFLIYFLDDDLMDIPLDIPSADYVIRSNAHKYIPAILEITDVLWTVNPRIARKYGKWCKRTAVLKVPAVTGAVEQKKYNQLPLRVLYAGSIDHSDVIQKKISPVIQKINLKYPEKFNFTFIGANPNLPKEKNVKYIPYYDSYSDYQNTVQNGNFVLGLAPLKTGDFYKYKYYNKFIEYSSFGIVGIYEDQQPYTDIVLDGDNGILAKNDDWMKSLVFALENRCILEKMAVSANELLKKSFSIDMVSRQLQTEIPELLIYNADHGRCSLPLSSHFLNIIYYKERVMYNFRRYGAVAIVVILFKLFRKLRSYILKSKDEK